MSSPSGGDRLGVSIESCFLYMSALHSRASLFKGRFELNQTYSEPNLCDMWTEDDGIAFIEKKKKKKKRLSNLAVIAVLLRAVFLAL